jgi:hypothetical protein
VETRVEHQYEDVCRSQVTKPRSWQQSKMKTLIIDLGEPVRLVGFKTRESNMMLSWSKDL